MGACLLKKNCCKHNIFLGNVLRVCEDVLVCVFEAI